MAIINVCEELVHNGHLYDNDKLNADVVVDKSLLKLSNDWYMCAIYRYLLLWLAKPAPGRDDNRLETFYWSEKSH